MSILGIFLSDHSDMYGEQHSNAKNSAVNVCIALSAILKTVTSELHHHNFSESYAFRLIYTYSFNSHRTHTTLMKCHTYTHTHCKHPYSRFEDKTQLMRRVHKTLTTAGPFLVFGRWCSLPSPHIISPLPNNPNTPTHTQTRRHGPPCAPVGREPYDFTRFPGF